MMINGSAYFWKQVAVAAAGIPIPGHKNIESGDKQDTVKLITFHSSKGLEFPLVAIPGASIPSGEEIATEEEAGATPK
jgi:ATP-dependent exoDNAse (exonuclease V) beta subunit